MSHSVTTSGGEQIGFRALDFADLPLMRRWLNRNHVARWWPGWPTLEQVRAKYAPRINRADSTRCFIIELGARPVGYIQCYYDAADSAALRKFVDDVEHAAGVDLFIGEQELLYRGVGPRIIGEFLREVVFADATITSCIIDPARNNAAAIRAYEKAGFRHLETVMIPGELEPAYLMRMARGEFEAAAARSA